MATNVCLNQLRRNRLEQDGCGNPDRQLLGRLAPLDEPRLLARFGLARLFGGELESTATIAVLHWVDGLTLEGVARQVGLSVSVGPRIGHFEA